MSLDLRSALVRHADAGRTALILAESGEEISYRALMAAIDRCAAAAQTLPRGTLVGVLAPRGVDAIAAFFGLMQAGACPCFIEPNLSGEAIAQRMAAVGMTLLLTDETIPGLPAGLTRSLRDFRDGGAATARMPELDAADRAMMLFSTGSTGQPKGILLSHGNLRSNASGVGAITAIDVEDRLLHVMPLHHTNGVNNQLVLPFLAGACVVLAQRFQAESLPDLLDRYAITYMTGVPTMFSRLLPHLTAGRSFPALRFLRCGSAPITDELHRQIEDGFDVELLVSYGSSEATCTNTMNPPGARKIGSVGTVLPGQQVKLFRLDSLSEVAAGEEGEVVIAGPNLMLGYIGTDVRSPIERGWLRSGDLGRFDEQGYLSITGRIKDVIIRGGENLSPAVIEAALLKVATLHSVCVVGRPDADLGEVPVAFVVPHPGKTVDVARLQALLAESLPRSYRPAEIVLRDSLPEIGVGKIDRKALRQSLRR